MKLTKLDLSSISYEHEKMAHIIKLYYGDGFDSWLYSQIRDFVRDKYCIMKYGTPFRT